MVDTQVSKTDRKTTVQVRIMGESFLISGSQPEQIVKSLAEELDVKLSGARKLMPAAAQHRVAISVALEQLAEIRALRRHCDELLGAFEKAE